MTLPHYSHEQLINTARFDTKDIEQIKRCRREYNRLGFSYQLAFVRLMNRFPAQSPLEILHDILTYVSVQLNISSKFIDAYTQRQPRISEHQETIRNYLGLRQFGENEIAEVKQFIFEEACRLEQTRALFLKTEQFLKEKGILKPSDDTLQRLIGNQRKEAKEFIFKKISGLLSVELLEKLDSLIDTSQKNQSDLQFLKQPPGRPSPSAMLKLTEKIEKIQSTGISEVDVSWLNNNFQRSLTHHAKRYTVTKLRRLQSDHRYAVLVCFLWQLFRDTIDFIVDMYDKLINKVYNHAQIDVDNHNKTQNKKVRKSLFNYKDLAELMLDDTVEDYRLRQEFFSHIGRDELTNELEEITVWLTGKHSNVFNLVKDRFSYIRQFSPAFIQHIHLISESEASNSSLFEAIDILREMNEKNKRKLPDNAPLDFIPKKIRPLVKVNEKIDKSAWECALLTAIRDEIKSGNVSVKMSKRFGHFDDFFIPFEKWQEMRESFFKRAGLPINPNDIEGYLKERLNKAFDQFLDKLPDNSYVKIDEEGWHLSADASEKMAPETELQLEHLKNWLSKNMRVIKLPELLIEVDNELKITKHFMPASNEDTPQVDEICAIIATIMAHGCNIGPYTMSHLTGISYNRIKHITDWMLTEESQRAALTIVVNAISQLDITQSWGEGKTSSSDGQRFEFNRKVLQQTYSQKFNDFALEFYSFVADNFAPFYSMPIECTDRDAPYVLDGLLYNESDLPLEEHYVDSHGYTENNFAAFGMFGRRFSPRIRGLHKQRIYRIDKNKDYKSLSPLVDKKDRTIHMDWIIDKWDRMGHFYASLECGHATASTAMKRLNGFTGKNHFYRANRELGRIFKTEHILQYMSDQALRQRTRRGLLKGEQLHALARDLNYGKRGRISNRDLQEQRNSCSCLTLILACIVYWQAKEINRVVIECNQEDYNIDLSLIEHISPITWDNVILYGEYVIDQNLIKL